MKRLLMASVVLGAAFAGSCTGAPVEEKTGTLASSPYADVLPGLVAVAGGYELFGAIDDPALTAADFSNGAAVPWIGGPTRTLHFNGSNFSYELTEDAPTTCACPSIDADLQNGEGGNRIEFIHEVEEPLRAGWFSMDIDVFWTIRSPTLLIEVVVLEETGERVVGAATHKFDYPWRNRSSVGLYADLEGVLPGQLVGVRMTMVDSDPGPAQFVFNAGPAGESGLDERRSYVYLPILGE